MSAAAGAVWPWPTKHTLRQRLRTSEAKRQQAGSAPPPPVLVNMQPFAPVRFRACQWLRCDGPPWIFCDAPTRSGSAWCEMHRAVVFEPREVADE